MTALEVVGKHLPKVADFYFGKSIFITGSGGFVGSVLLENLLRSCPGIKSIFILLRSKKNINVEDRKQLILNKKVFEKLKVDNRMVFEKVHVIAGEASLPKLGMSEEDIKLLIEEVSVVFHCAATVNFMKPLKYILLNNIGSLISIIELSRRMRKLKALVYTSSAYCNCNHSSAVYEEEVYRLPFRAEKFIDAFKNEDYEKLQELCAHCKPDWPNLYTFSKCLAENVIKDTSPDLPIAIVRPSMIINTWKNPISGYDEGQTGPTLLLIGAGRGYLKVSYSDPNIKLDLVPADIVANTHVLAACCIGTKKWMSPMIVNCTATEKLQVTMLEYSKTVIQLALKFPIPQALLKNYNFYQIPNKYIYYILRAYHHYLPAIVLEGIMRISGKKSNIYSTFKYFDKVVDSVAYFQFRTFNFERKNLEHLDKLIHPEDRQDLNLDFKDATIQDIVSKIPQVSPFYDWKRDNESPSEREKIKYRIYIMVRGIQGMFIISSVTSIYCLAGFFF